MTERILSIAEREAAVAHFAAQLARQIRTVLTEHAFNPEAQAARMQSLLSGKEEWIRIRVEATGQKSMTVICDRVPAENIVLVAGADVQRVDLGIGKKADA